MGLDIRLPLGLLFLLTGAIMTVYGLFTRSTDLYAKCMGVNLNFWWGMALAVFGLLMLLSGRRNARKARDGA